MPRCPWFGFHALMKQSRTPRARSVPIRAPRVWNLTSAEARVVESLAKGRRPMEIATELRLSIHTIRTQLKRAMAKTGAHTQTALVSMFYSARNQDDQDRR